MSKIVRAVFEKSAKTTFFDKKLLIKKIGARDEHDVNTKSVAIDNIYLNMQNDSALLLFKRERAIRMS